MLLYPDLTHSVIIDGVEYEVNTKYFIVLKVLEYSSDKELSNAQKVVYCLKLFYKNGFGKDIEKAYEAMWAWINDANLRINDIGDKKIKEPILDYKRDDQFIFASMCQVYGNDWKQWHWYEWKAAFDNLPETAPIKQIMNIRMQEVSLDMDAEEKIKLRKLKATYALESPKKERTGEEILAALQERERKKCQTAK